MRKMWIERQLDIHRQKLIDDLRSLKLNNPVEFYDLMGEIRKDMGEEFYDRYLKELKE